MSIELLPHITQITHLRSLPTSQTTPGPSLLSTWAFHYGKLSSETCLYGPPSYNAFKLRCLYLRFFFTFTYSHLRPKTLNTHKPVISDEVSRGAESDDISALPYCSICDRYFSSTSWYSKVSSMRILSHDLFDIVCFVLASGGRTCLSESNQRHHEP